METVFGLAYGRSSIAPTYKVCSKCSKEFETYLTPEEMLLRAIFCEKPLCPECTREENTPKCVKCGEFTEENVFYNDRPFHSKCMPFLGG